jgi:hypothetical protein
VAQVTVYARTLGVALAQKAYGTRDGKPFQATHLFITSLRTTPETLLQLVRDRWSIEGWYWIRDTQLHEDDHRYRGNGAGVMATLRTAALNLLLLAGFPSIRNDSRRTLRRLPHLVPIGLQRLPNRSQINLLAVSQFGRRLRENGSRGTDHGSVSIALLLGDQVPHPSSVPTQAPANSTIATTWSHSCHLLSSTARCSRLRLAEFGFFHIISCYGGVGDQLPTAEH